ncbi:MAG: hypothetical protein GXY38_03565 [Planctomycetes bacterium]|nr:hypothetical protein [Planctomycetota bacterium]
MANGVKSKRNQHVTVALDITPFSYDQWLAARIGYPDIGQLLQQDPPDGHLSAQGGWDDPP